MKKLLLTAACFLPLSCFGQWTFELGSGFPYNFDTHLNIEQHNQPDIDWVARYNSNPFEMPLYYDLKIAKWSDCGAWEFEDIHHKIYLQNKNDDVQNFSISHGYNLFYFNRTVLWQNLVWRLGAGVVLAHPENTIRNLKFPQTGGTCNEGGYYLAGASFQASIAKRFHFTRQFFLEVEGKLTASEAHVKVVDGHADAPNIAVHGIVSLGFETSRH